MSKKCLASIVVLVCVCTCMPVCWDEANTESRGDDEAILRYEQIARKHPRTQEAADALYKAGILYENQERFGEAMESYKLAVSNSANKSFIVKVQFQIGQIYEKAKDHGQAIKVYRDCLNKCSTKEQFARVMRQIAYVYLGQEKYSKGVDTLKKIMKKFPDTVHAPDAQFLIAVTYYRKVKDYPKAIEEYRKMVKDYPEDWRVPISLAYIAEIYVELKDYEKAIEMYGRIIETYPGTDDAKAAKARVRLINGYYKKGITPSLKEMQKVFREEGICK